MPGCYRVMHAYKIQNIQKYRLCFFYQAFFLKKLKLSRPRRER
jgi:hypothetical protein